MARKSLKKAAGALGLAFMLAASPLADTPAEAARNTEPYSCKINGRVYDPQPASIVIDTASGRILGGQNIDEQRYPASMTKMMTVALIFDALREGRLDLDDKITVRLSDDIRDTYSNSRSTWLTSGTTMTVEQAILAIAVASANNVSVIMAEALEGSEAAFVKKMNEKAAAIGMQKTVFTNSHGLPDRQQVTTARDMAKLALYLQQEYPEYYHYFSAAKAEFGPWQGRNAKRNHNELVTRNQYIDGIKTGFICDSGYNVAISAERGNAGVITIVFGGRTPHQRNVQAQQLTDGALRRMLQNALPQNEPAHIHDDLDSRPAEPQGSMDAGLPLVPYRMDPSLVP